jgi:8-oxo-dGTP pyrophosphatase MutT (NUDIX family)
MSAGKISLDSAKPDKLFYFVANALVYRETDSRCLILKRAAREKAHPSKWCTPGGKLEWKDLDLAYPSRMNGEIFDFEDVIEELLAREVKEEAGVDIDLLRGMKYVNSIAFVRPDGIPVVLVKLAAYYKGGEVEIERDSFDDFAWVNADEVKKYDCILGIPEEVERTIGLFAK